MVVTGGRGGWLLCDSDSGRALQNRMLASHRHIGPIAAFFFKHGYLSVTLALQRVHQCPGGRRWPKRHRGGYHIEGPRSDCGKSARQALLLDLRL